VLIISPGAVMDTIRSVDANLATSVCLFGLSGLLAAASSGGGAPAEGSTPPLRPHLLLVGTEGALNGQHFDDDEDQLFFVCGEGSCGRVGGSVHLRPGTPV
jgi:hypothetical protein